MNVILKRLIQAIVSVSDHLQLEIKTTQNKSKLAPYNMLIPVLAMMVFLPPLSYATSNFPHIKIGSYDLGATTIPSLAVDPALQQQVVKWQAERSDFIVGGKDPHPYNASTINTQYRTILGSYWPTSGNVYATVQPNFQVKDWAEAQGYDFENFFLHMKMDYESNNSWDMTKFDKYENAHGVIVDNSGVFSDKTLEAYNTYPGDVQFNNNLYIGLEYPFAEINFTMSRMASNLTGSFQYWNGTSWADLTVTDGTSQLSQNGKVTFIPPADWRKTVVMGSRNKYFVRYHVVSATVLPYISQILGDNWMTGTLCRGWDKDDPNIVNKGLGELEFNPNPPAGATAKFRYQARAGGYWSPNYCFWNPAYVVNGKRPWADFEAMVASNEIATKGLDGVYYDSLGGSLLAGLKPAYASEANTDLSDYTTGTLNENAITNYQYLLAKIHELQPNALVGGNTYIRSFALTGDYSLNEYAASTSVGGAINIMSSTGANNTSAYDDYKPSNNPSGKKYIVQHTDLFDHRTSGGGAFIDRANRGPLVALTSHYIAMNDNTYFHYYTTGGAWYTETDEVAVFNPSTTVLTADIQVDTSSNVKTIHGADFSAFPASGKDQNYGQGARPVKLGDNQFINFTKVDNQTLTTTSPIYYAIPNGATVKFVDPTLIRQSSCTSSECAPKIQNVYRWAKFFPAMFVDIGLPDPSGWNGGNRGQWNSTYIVWRRDFTNAIVLNKPAAGGYTKAQYDTYTPPLDLGGVYYPLNADGTIGDGITSISLRPAEGAILLKSPVVSGISPMTNDTTPPNVSITSPNNNSLINGVNAINVNATDNVNVSKIEIYINGTLISTITNTPYSYDWDTKTYSNGVYDLVAYGFDSAGNMGSSTHVSVTVNNDRVAPLVSITSPSNGTTVTGTSTINTSAVDNVAVTKVELYINGKLLASKTAAPFSFTWNSATYPVGANNLVAYAYDAAGNIGKSTQISLSVKDAIAPVVTIISPKSGSVVSSKVTINANAADNIAVTKMQIYVDNMLKSTVSTGSISWSMYTSNLAKGAHFISVRALDASGNIGRKDITVYK